MELMLIFGSTILAILDIVYLLVVAKRLRWGWLLGIIVNTLWFPYDLWTHQFGFFLLGFVYYYVYWIGWKHHNDSQQ